MIGSYLYPTASVAGPSSTAAGFHSFSATSTINSCRDRMGLSIDVGEPVKVLLSIGTFV